jgi:hypothetical protein
VENEINHQYVVELGVVSDGLDRIGPPDNAMQFHKSRNIQPRYGRIIPAMRGKVYYRWCFSDSLIARVFAEQFDGKILQT